ncbi:MFS transporter [Sphingomicrobium sediminis]|uniref:MFS transporter n=1 Tax=Sphingomicrobium sediminis TaxID=2950949 RepID=A0A9X2J2N2_9SPHN|nr:MFS transporter [Sphingomicrobium sediminis]MCM8556466.1 MFS transporter [Sphingomicrobium sediminis]
MSHQTPHDCDPRAASAADTAPSGNQSHPRSVLIMSVLASSLAFIDGSIVTVALPAIRADLDASAAAIQWVVNAYFLPLAALLLIGGALGDHYGRKTMLMLGTALFGAASLLCALVPTLEALIIGRAGQGIGGALLLPNSLALLNGAFAGEARGRAVGTWAAAGAIGGAVAPLAGGWIVENYAWPAIFWLLVPLSIAAITIALTRVDEVTSGDTNSIDWPGAATATIGLGGIALALTFWSEGGSITTNVVTAGIVGLGFLAFFLKIERAAGDHAMMPLGLFGGQCVVALNLLTFLLYGALGALLLILPYLLIESGGYSETLAGLAIMPFPLIIGLGSPIMGGIAERIGARLPLTIGPLVVAGGLLLGMRISEGSDYWTTVLPAIAVVGIGMALAVAPLTSAVMAAVEERYTGTASGLNNAVSRTGNLIAVALMGGVLSLTGSALFGGFHDALLAMAAAAALAGVVAWFGLSNLNIAKD